MRYWALDVIACLYDKHYPLELVVFSKEEENIDVKDIPKPYCQTYCGYLKEKIREGKEYPCEKCLRIEIVEGIVYCPKCLHWYPIKNGILIMLPDNKRNEKNDRVFLEKHKDSIPDKILNEGKPVNLSSG